MLIHSWKRLSITSGVVYPAPSIGLDISPMVRSGKGKDVVETVGVDKDISSVSDLLF